MINRIGVGGWLGLACLLYAWTLAAAAEPLSPQQEQKTIKLAPGLRLELVAAEPQVTSPVAMAFDEHGKLWVVEMRDYPNGPAKGKPPEGRIKVLEDKDGDGLFETATIFADKLLFANSLLPWRGGVIVTAAPYIVYLKDTDGAGKADHRETLFEGFAAQNPQLRVSHPILGIDNWIYVVNGLRGGQVKRAGSQAKPINISGMDFRFDLLKDKYEAITGMGQFGNTFDAWGRRFVCTNRNHLIPIVLPQRYVKRNPFLVPPARVRDNQRFGGAARTYPISKNFTTSSAHAGTFSAACGVTVYLGDLLPAAFQGNAYTCDPTGNLVHREVLHIDGASFRGTPGRKGVEFLASSDDWCRPVSLANGPDGAFYVVDMYRKVIEHPQFMTPEYKAQADLHAGKDKGRIWRIVPEGYKHKKATVNLGKARPDELAALLSHANAWYRKTAQRLLLDRLARKEVDAVESLQQLVQSAEKPLGRVHAAWLLRYAGKLQDKDVLSLLNAREARVRDHGLQLVAERGGTPKDPGIVQKVVALAKDPDPRVRFQTALVLGDWDFGSAKLNQTRIIAPLTRIALAAEDPWTRAAVATAVPKQAGALLVSLLSTDTTPSRESQLVMVEELAALVGARRAPEEIADVLDAVGRLPKDKTSWQLTGLQGLAQGLGRRGGRLSDVLRGLATKRKSAVDQANQLLSMAGDIARDPKKTAGERTRAAQLLAHASWASVKPVLVTLVKNEPAQDVQLAAVRALSAHPQPEVPQLLMAGWPGYTPAVRREVTEAMFRDTKRIAFLLKEVEAGRVKPGDIGSVRVRRLLKHGNATIRNQAKKLLSASLPADRKKVLARYQAALKLPADPRRGLMVFKKNCATCHHIAGIGVDVGPRITDTLGKTPAALLQEILIPNQAIDNNYVNYVVTTKSGKLLTGIIAAENASSITLRRAENQTDAILRQDIDEIQSTGVSLMPEGLEKEITVQNMADLLAFLKKWRYLKK